MNCKREEKGRRKPEASLSMSDSRNCINVPRNSISISDPEKSTVYPWCRKIKECATPVWFFFTHNDTPLLLVGRKIAIISLCIYPYNVRVWILQKSFLFNPQFKFLEFSASLEFSILSFWTDNFAFQNPCWGFSQFDICGISGEILLYKQVFHRLALSFSL